MKTPALQMVAWMLVLLAAVSCRRKADEPVRATPPVQPVVQQGEPAAIKEEPGRVVQMTHDRAKQELVLLFESGDCLAFEGVPEALYMEMVQAGSAQRFFEERIKGWFVSRPSEIRKPARPPSE